MSAHPRLYWNDHCAPGGEWVKFTKKEPPEDRLWAASAEETSFPSAIALPGHENLGLADPDFMADCPERMARNAQLWAVICGVHPDSKDTKVMRIVDVHFDVDPVLATATLESGKLLVVLPR